jgi:hypothetical protein
VAGPCGANAGAKIGCLVAGMAAGADYMDDMDVLRHGAIGGADSARGAASLASDAFGAARDAGTVIARADSAYYSAAFAATCSRAGARFSVTPRMDPAIRAPITAIPPQAWTPIRYPAPSGTPNRAAGAPTPRSPRPPTARSPQERKASRSPPG